MAKLKHFRGSFSFSIWDNDPLQSVSEYLNYVEEFYSFTRQDLKKQVHDYLLDKTYELNSRYHPDRCVSLDRYVISEIVYNYDINDYDSEYWGGM